MKGSLGTVEVDGDRCSVVPLDPQLATDLLSELGDEVHSSAFCRGKVETPRQADAIVGDGQSSPAIRYLEEDADLPFGRGGIGVLEGVRKELVENEPKGHRVGGAQSQVLYFRFDGDEVMIKSHSAGDSADQVVYVFAHIDVRHVFRQIEVLVDLRDRIDSSEGVSKYGFVLLVPKRIQLEA